MLSFLQADREARGATLTRCGKPFPLAGPSPLFQAGQIVVDSCRVRVWLAYRCCTKLSRSRPNAEFVMLSELGPVRRQKQVCWA